MKARQNSNAKGKEDKTIKKAINKPIQIRTEVEEDALAELSNRASVGGHPAVSSEKPLLIRIPKQNFEMNHEISLQTETREELNQLLEEYQDEDGNIDIVTLRNDLKTIGSFN